MGEDWAAGKERKHTRVSKRVCARLRPSGRGSGENKVGWGAVIESAGEEGCAGMCDGGSEGCRRNEAG